MYEPKFVEGKPRKSRHNKELVRAMQESERKSL